MPNDPTLLELGPCGDEYRMPDSSRRVTQMYCFRALSPELFSRLLVLEATACVACVHIHGARGKLIKDGECQ